LSLTISPIRQDNRIVGASHVARDITTSKRLEAAHAQLAAIVESSEDAIISQDLKGDIETWNAAANRIYGYTAREAIGRNIRLLLPPGRVAEEEQILERLTRGDRVEHFETTRLRRDEKLIDVSLTMSPIRDTAGRVTGFSHVARDITQRKQFEEQMRQTQRLE